MNCTPAALSSFSRCWCLPGKSRRGALIYLLCQWAKKKVSDSSFLFTPDTAVITWTDSGNVHTGNLATFNATANKPTVTNVTATGVGLTAITGIQSLTALTTLLLTNNSLVSIDCHGMPTLLALRLSGNTPLTTVIANDCLIGSSTSLLSSCPNLVFVNLKNNGLSGPGPGAAVCQVDVDGASNGFMDISGNDALSAAGLVCKGHLVVKGWTVLP